MSWRLYHLETWRLNTLGIARRHNTGWAGRQSGREHHSVSLEWNKYGQPLLTRKTMQTWLVHGLLRTRRLPSDHETPKEQDAPSSCVADQEGVPISLPSSSFWEVVTTANATFLGYYLVTHAAHAWVAVPAGTYSRSCSSLETINSWADGATDFEHPRV